MTFVPYVLNAVNNILAGLLVLKDSDGESLISATSPSLIYPPTYPFLCAYPGGISPAGQRTPAGDSFASDQWGVIVRYIAGKAGDGYLNDQEEKLWVWTQLMLETLRKYPTLNFPLDPGDPEGDRQPEIEELAIPYAQVNGVSRFGVFRDDVQHLGFEITITLPFNVDNDRDWR